MSKIDIIRNKYQKYQRNEKVEEKWKDFFSDLDDEAKNYLKSKLKVIEKKVSNVNAPIFGFFLNPTAYTAYNVHAKIIITSPLFSLKLSKLLKSPALTTNKTAIKVIRTPQRCINFISSFSHILAIIIIKAGIVP